MRDKLEMYLQIKKQFPSMAGNIERIFASQRRQLTALGFQKEPKVKDLMLTTSEGQDAVKELLEWMRKVLQGVCDDAELIEGTKAQNTITLLNEEMNRLRGIVNLMTGADRVKK